MFLIQSWTDISVCVGYAIERELLVISTAGRP